MPSVRHPRGTRAALDALAGSNALKPGQIYLITDEARIAIALTAGTYQAYMKSGEGGGGGSGDVVGPASSVAHSIPTFADATGKVLQQGAYFDLIDVSAPAPPAGAVRLFGRQIAGRMFPAFVGPSGLDTAIQPFLARNKMGYWCPPGNATTVPGVLGFPAPTITGFTATARNVATTNRFTRMRRLGYVTSNATGTVGHWRVNAYQYTTGGAGLGGFTYIKRFGVSDAQLVASARMFIGMRASSTPANVEPSTLTNCFGVGHGAGQTTLSFYYGGSAAQTPVSLGAGFPVGLSSQPYELALFSPPNATVCHWAVTNLASGAVAFNTISGGAAVLPQENTLLAPWGYRTNNTDLLSVGLDVMSAYIETDF